MSILLSEEPLIKGVQRRWATRPIMGRHFVPHDHIDMMWVCRGPRLHLAQHGVLGIGPDFGKARQGGFQYVTAVVGVQNELLMTPIPDLPAVIERRIDIRVRSCADDRPEYPAIAVAVIHIAIELLDHRIVVAHDGVGKVERSHVGEAFGCDQRTISQHLK